MATAGSSFTSIDPTKNAKFPVSISEQLLREDGPRKRQRISVQLNHRPKSSQSLQRTTIIPSKDGRKGQYDLVIEDEDRNDRYFYTGAQRATETTALIYDPTTQSIALDRIDSEFLFNLRSTPSNKDSANLASQYPQLNTGLTSPENDDDHLFDTNADTNGQRSEDAEPDAMNPYDYRHFLRQRHSSSSSPTSRHNIKLSPRPVGLSPSQQSTNARSRTPKQRPRDRLMYLSPSPAQREEADADNEDSDPNELIIDMGDSVKIDRTRHRSALGILNEGGRSRGPISLRSAASSMSPPIRGQRDREEEQDGDDDVEGIDLGNPHIDLPRQSHEEEELAVNGNGWDDEDDMAAELENAMMQEQAEEPAETVINQSSSESEEE